MPFEHWVSRLTVRTCLDALRAEKARPEWRMADLMDLKTAHTLNPVPLILYDNTSGGKLGLKQTETAGLSNIAATIANLLGLEKHDCWDDSLLTIK